MKIVIIGGKGAKKIAQVIQKTTDEEVKTYPNVVNFLNEAAMRSLTIHRVIVMQDGIDEVEDQKVYDFVDFLTNYYPSVRIVTISKNPEIAKFFGDLITSIYAVHFMIESIRSKMVIELAVGRIEDLNKRYSNIIYKKKNETFTNIIEDESSNNNNENNSKNGFLRKLFGMGPKNKKNTNNTQNISINHQPNSKKYHFEEKPEENEEVLPSEEIEFDMLDDFESDIGLGGNSKDEEKNDEFFENFGDEDFEEDFEDEDFEEEDFEEDFEEEDFEEDFQEDFQEDFDDDSFEDEDEVSEKNEVSKPIKDTSNTLNQDKNKLSYTEKLKQQKEKMLSDFDELVDEKIETSHLNQENPEKVGNHEMTLEEIDDDDLGLSGEQLDKLLKESEKNNTKVVEKLITVTKGGKNSYRNKNGVRLIIVTGDRRIGATKLSFNLAHMYSKNEKTLLVDFDRFRKGMLGYIGIEYVIDFIDFKQNGVKFLSTGKRLESLTYPFPNSDFDVLGSMYGEEITDNQIKVAQKTLYNQKDYDTVIIDCPLENIYLLEDLIYASNILYCIEDTKIGVTNSILSLNSSVDDKMLTPLYNNVNFVVGRTANIGKFRENLDKISELFGLDETTTDWGKVKILGTLTQEGTKELAMVMED